MNGDIFRTYVKQVLAPTLKRGDIVVLDNLSSHKVIGIRQAIETADAALVYLLSYSPDFNPIEHAFAKLRYLRLRARRGGRSDLIGTPLAS